MDSQHTKAITDCSSLHLSLYEPPYPVEVAGYRECRKNHAVRLGRLALDGCREFMPSTGWNPVGSSDIPAFLTCAACGCHRNFHRRDIQAGSIPSSPKPLSPIPTSYYVPVSAPWLVHDLRNNISLRHDPVTLTPPTDNVEEREEDDNWDGTTGTRATRKRERTKFSKEQKEKMEAFADKVGWTMKIAGSDEDIAVENFCKEIGVSRGVLKIWMNNHKQRKLYPRS